MPQSSSSSFNLKSSTNNPSSKEKAPFSDKTPTVTTSLNEPDPELEGTWKAQADTPMGCQKAEVKAIVKGTALTGTMFFMGKKLTIQNGTATKAGFSYDIQVRIMLSKIDAKISGTRNGNMITGIITSSMGSLPFTAERA